MTSFVKCILGLAVTIATCHCVPHERLSRHKRVIGGLEYAKGEYPFHASLWFMADNPYTEKTPGLHHMCGGSLIKEQWVLTAAICFDERVMEGFSNLTLWQVYLGMHAQTDAMEEAQGYQIDRVFFAPEYNLTELYGDLALVKLKEPAVLSEFVDTIEINQDPACPAVNQEATIIGWGQTQNETYGLGSDVPYKATVKTFSIEQCQDAYLSPEVLEDFGSDLLRLDDTALCAGLPEGGVDGCSGDSGSPLFATCGYDTVPALAATQSYGYGCAQPGYPGVYTRVSAFSDWITQTLRDN